MQNAYMNIFRGVLITSIYYTEIIQIEKML